MAVKGFKLNNGTVEKYNYSDLDNISVRTQDLGANVVTSEKMASDLYSAMWCMVNFDENTVTWTSTGSVDRATVQGTIVGNADLPVHGFVTYDESRIHLVELHRYTRNNVTFVVLSSYNPNYSSVHGELTISGDTLSGTLYGHIE